MLQQIKNLFAFLTILPAKMNQDCLSDCAKYMFLFPIIGGLIGFLGGVFGWAISWFLPALIVGPLTLAILLLLTGLHHTDGLLDFGDAVMAHGTAERKIEIMHDQLTGAGGLTLGIMTMLVTALCIAQIRFSILIQGIIVVEVAAKLSMVIGSWAGRAVHEGMNSSFLSAMHGSKGDARLVGAIAISFAIAAPLLQVAGFAAVAAGIITAFVMVGISHRHFRGVTGDVLGATNELARLSSLIVLLAMIR